MRVFSSLEDLQSAIGTSLGPSSWLAIDQDRITKFADATNDHQWIHVDPVRAASSPFGGTIAHGYLSLSLVAGLHSEIYTLDFPDFLINYGLGRVRFPAPVHVNSRVRLHVEITSLESATRGHLLTTKHTLEIEGITRPACVAETLTLLVL